MSKTTERLRQLILDKNLKVKDFANLIGVAPQTVSRMLSGTYPVTERTAVKISNALEISSDYILGKTDDCDLPKKGYDVVQDVSVQTYKFDGIKLALERLGYTFNEYFIVNGTRCDCNNESLAKKVEHANKSELFIEVLNRSKINTYEYNDFVCMLNNLMVMMDNYMRAANHDFKL